jgi:hypothetical protein
LESNWRYNREVFGIGGEPLLIPLWSVDPVQFACELVTPVSLPGGVCTHIIFGVDRPTGRQVALGHLLMGYLQLTFRTIRSHGFKPGDVWPVLPD